MSIIQTLLKPGDTIGLIACSDGIKPEYQPKVDELIAVMHDFGLHVDIAETLYRGESFFSGTPTERAAEFNRLFATEAVRAVMDISGGDSANQILPYIDFEMIKRNPKPFFGMSDLSVILNTLYHKCDLTAYHYQGMNMLYSGPEQQKMFYRTFFEGRSDLFDIGYAWICGNSMQGIVVGGNVRCFLKLAGTPYFPQFDGKILFLESLGGRANRILSLLAQLSQIGAFTKCSGVILGSFSEVEQYDELPMVFDHMKELSAVYHLPVVKTNELGHGGHCKCIKIGAPLALHR